MITESDLAQFTGTEHYYKNFLGLLYTDGVQYLAEKVGAYWLIDTIGSYQKKLTKNGRLKDFQLWKLTVNVAEKSGILVCREDTGKLPVVTQALEYTDFPFDITLYVENGVLLLPSEH